MCGVYVNECERGSRLCDGVCQWMEPRCKYSVHCYM